ncbi:hypothetical protein QYF36_003805 [Acer negundo]|nr:hypothetical protein QYF36_003805 [Acer negundo]
METPPKVRRISIPAENVLFKIFSSSSSSSLAIPRSRTLQCCCRAMILAAALQQHCKVLDLGIARDDEEELEKILNNTFSAGIDILLTFGGVSLGDKDFVKPLLEKSGTVYFDKVCMKPGKPLTFAEINSRPAENKTVNKILAFGLPGNPVSCLVCFHLFVVPTIRHLSGWANPHLWRLLKLLKHCSLSPSLLPIA